MKKIDLLDLKLEYGYMKADIDAAIKKCLEHQTWIMGPEVKELETKVAEYLGAKHCVGVSSGTDALVLSLRAMAMKKKGREFFDKKDRIITTPFTFVATADAILRSGATPVFVDIDPRTFNIDPARVKECPGAVGIIPVHLYGQACDMDEITGIAAGRGLFVLEDAAQSFGSMWKDKKLGSIGDAGALSFFPSKNLGSFGDGGMVVTGDDGIAESVRMLLKHGGKDKYNVDHVGYNARLDTLQAAVLLAKMKYIDEFNARRRKIAETYSKGLKDIEGISVPEALPGSFHTFHQYTIKVSGGRRDQLQAFLKEKGISSMVYYPVTLSGMKVFEGRAEVSGSLDQAEKATKEVLSLPIEPLFRDEINEVIDAIKGFFTGR